MRKLLLGTVFAAIAVIPTFAADLPVRPVYKAPPPPAPVYGWTGFYFGANIGYSWGRMTNDFNVAGVGTFAETQRMDGVIGGFQWGYNWQLGNYVFGTESDFMFSGERGSTTYCGGACVADHRLTWVGTGRGRLGVLATPNVLLYATAGVAYGQIRSDYTFPAVATTLSFRDTRVGWTAGAGVEGMIAPNWLARVEYLYVDLGTDRVTQTTGGVNVFSLNRRFNDSIGRLALSYKLGGM